MLWGAISYGKNCIITQHTVNSFQSISVQISLRYCRLTFFPFLFFAFAASSLRRLVLWWFLGLNWNKPMPQACILNQSVFLVKRSTAAELLHRLPWQGDCEVGGAAPRRNVMVTCSKDRVRQAVFCCSWFLHSVANDLYLLFVLSFSRSVKF